MDVRIFVTGETDVSNLAGGFRPFERFHDAAPGEMAVGIVVVHAFVDLPEIEVVGPKPPKRFVELTQRGLPVTTVRAHLGHEEDGIPAISDRPSHAPFALAVVI